jgi:hypothetical protein
MNSDHFTGTMALYERSNVVQRRERPAIDSLCASTAEALKEGRAHGTQDKATRRVQVRMKHNPTDMPLRDISR